MWEGNYYAHIGDIMLFPGSCMFWIMIMLSSRQIVHLSCSYSQCISERMQNRRLRNGQTFTGARAFSRQKCFFRSFKVTNANIETKLEQMCCTHTRLVVCAQEHNDFSGGSP